MVAGRQDVHLRRVQAHERRRLRLLHPDLDRDETRTLPDLDSLQHHHRSSTDRSGMCSVRRIKLKTFAW
jgi:hypothetical protein